MADIILFHFESNEIRFVGTGDNPEWIAADICKALDLDNVSKALEGLEPEEKGITNSDDGSLTGSQTGENRRRLVGNSESDRLEAMRSQTSRNGIAHSKRPAIVVV